MEDNVKFLKKMQNKIKNLIPNKVKKPLKITFKVLIALILLVACIASGLLIGVFAGVVFTTKSLTDTDLKISAFTSFIYDNKENVIAEMKGSENKNRIWIPIAEVPKNLKEAFISIEDERFYSHIGIDIKRSLSAALSYVVPGMKSHGGSTITQQVVKNVTGDDTRSVPRKIREQWRALQLERSYNKDEILEVYLNVIFMGYDVYGIKTAARAYFNKDVSELDLAECALLAGITNNPMKYNPLVTTGRTQAINRQILILKKMYQLGKISAEDLDKALKEQIVFNDGYKVQTTFTSKNTYFVDQVITDVRSDLIEKGYTKEQANNLIYNNGIKIYTTQDPDIQKIIDEEYNDIENFPANKTIKDVEMQAQSAITILDQKNGQVKGVYGGYGTKTINLSFNRATMMKRQPGSSFKPLVAYGPMMDNHIITPATVFDDAPIRMDIQNPDKLWPNNYSNDYQGLLSARLALDKSTNVVAVKVFNQNMELGLSYIKKLGIDRSNEKNLSIAIGGLNNGVNPLLMAAAYAPFANAGIYNEPTFYTKVEDINGNLIISKTPESHLVYNDDRTPSIMTYMLRDVVENGTAHSNINIKNKNGQYIPTAGKTGTSTNDVDVWFVGYTSYYTCATWYGYDNARYIPGAEYFSAQKIWNKVMNKIHENLEPVEFTKASNLVEKEVCIYSGKIPTDLCRNDPRGNAVRIELFMAGTEPKDNDYCTLHVIKNVCISSKDIFGKYPMAGPNCPLSSIQTMSGTLRSTMPDIRPGDPWPQDWGYELSHDTCNVHTSNINTPMPSSTPNKTDKTDKTTNTNKPTENPTPSKTPSSTPTHLN